MGVYDAPLNGTLYEAGASIDEELALDASRKQQSIDSEFLDAVCNGVVVVGRDFYIVSQNYISRVNMGDLVGKQCFEVLENRSEPCDQCPRLKASADFETSMRCAGKGCSLYEVHIYPSEKDGEIVEVYPDMIDRELVVKNLHLYREELDLLSNVVEHIRNAIADDERK